MSANRLIYYLPGDTMPSLARVGTFSVEPFMSHTHRDRFYASTSHDDYIKSLQSLIPRLARGGGKTVISTVIDGWLPDGTNVMELFGALRPDTGNFRAMWFTGKDVWLMSTPELLLEWDGQKLSTMAVAGTRQAGTEGPWDDKNIREQAFVTQGIMKVWKDRGLDPVAGATVTVRAGKAEHIMTPVSAPAPGGKVDRRFFDSLAAAMHPTAATCGDDPVRAMADIIEAESHKRLYYTGYVTIPTDNGFSAYVILRCAHIAPSGRYNVFAGGGITGDSDPESEWLETRLKARAMTDILSPNIPNP